MTYLGAATYAGGVTATVPTDSGPSNVRMTPAAIDALHKLARPQAESVARAIASIGQVPGNPVEAPNGNGNGRQYLAIVPDDEYGSGRHVPRVRGQRVPGHGAG